MFRSTRKVVLAEDTNSGTSGFITRSAYALETAGVQPTPGVTFSRSTNTIMNTPKKPTLVETAAYSSSGLPASTQINEVSAAQLMTGVLEQILDQTAINGVNRNVNKIYADMYYHDSICGSAVDLMSTLPFSDFSLTGIKDTRMLQKFQDSLESMSIATLLPSLSIDYLVMGSFLGSLSWDEQSNSFNSIVPHNIDLAEIRPVPIFGEDPLINISIPEDILRTMRSDDERLEQFKERIPDELRAALNVVTSTSNKNKSANSTIKLDPNSTIFIPRRALLRDYAGVSLFKRALPAWFVEKALIRGTIDQAYKRQRAALHITVGDGTNWVPTKDQMAEIANLFLNIDLDPVGALVVTRNDVNVNEVRRGDDYYKWTDAYDSLSTIKFRSIGISETFITGEANWSTMDKTLSVMLEGIKNYRALVTQEVFYNKVFPAIAQENGILRKRFSSVETAANLPDNWVNPLWHKGEDGTYIAEIGSAPSVRDFDSAKFVLPRMQWHKQLLPEADEAYMTLLDTLQQKGIPIPLRIMAAAGGLKLDNVFDSIDADLRDRKRLKEYSDKLKEFAPEPAEGGSGDFGGDEEASVNLTHSGPIITGRGGSLIPRGLGTREHADTHLTEVQNTRKGRTVFTTKKGRDVLTERLHKTVATAAAKLAAKENHRQKQEFQATKTYSYSKGNSHGQEDK